MNKEFYLDLFRKKEILKQDDESEEGLQIQSKGKINFSNNVFNHCILIFNFRGPEDKEDDNDGF